MAVGGEGDLMVVVVELDPEESGHSTISSQKSSAGGTGSLSLSSEPEWQLETNGLAVQVNISVKGGAVRDMWCDDSDRRLLLTSYVRSLRLWKAICL
jgi:hypothetical protein